jgi:hypothetical protein
LACHSRSAAIVSPLDEPFLDCGFLARCGTLRNSLLVFNWNCRELPDVRRIRQHVPAQDVASRIRAHAVDCVRENQVGLHRASRHAKHLRYDIRHLLYVAAAR